LVHACETEKKKNRGRREKILKGFWGTKIGGDWGGGGGWGGGRGQKGKTWKERKKIKLGENQKTVILVWIRGIRKTNRGGTSRWTQGGCPKGGEESNNTEKKNKNRLVKKATDKKYASKETLQNNAKEKAPRARKGMGIGQRDCQVKPRRNDQLLVGRSQKEDAQRRQETKKQTKNKRKSSTHRRKL